MLGVVLALLLAPQGDTVDELLERRQSGSIDAPTFRHQALDRYQEFTEAQLAKVGALDAGLGARIAMRRRLGRSVVGSIPDADEILLSQQPSRVRVLLKEAGKLPEAAARSVVDVLAADLRSGELLVMAAPGAPAAYWDRVRDLMAHEDATVREVAIEVLGESGAARYGDDLAKLLDSLDARTRAKALRSIRYLRAESAGAKVAAKLSDRTERVRLEAVDCLRALRATGDARALTPLLADESPRVRLNALNAMFDLGVEGLADAAIACVNDKSLPMRLRAIEIVGLCGGVAHRKGLAGLLEDSDDTVKARAGLALARLGVTGHSEAMAVLMAKAEAAPDAIEALGVLNARDHLMSVWRLAFTGDARLRRAVIRYVAATDAFEWVGQIPDIAAGSDSDVEADARWAVASFALGRENEAWTLLERRGTLKRDMKDALARVEVGHLLSLPEGAYRAEPRSWGDRVRAQPWECLIAGEAGIAANAKDRETLVAALRKFSGNEDCNIEARISLLRLGEGDEAAAARLIEDAGAADAALSVRAYLLNVVTRRFSKLSEALDRPVKVTGGASMAKELVAVLADAGLRLQLDGDRPLAFRSGATYETTARAAAQCHLRLTSELVLHVGADSVRVLTLQESEAAWIRRLRK